MVIGLSYERSYDMSRYLFLEDFLYCTRSLRDIPTDQIQIASTTIVMIRLVSIKGRDGDWNCLCKVNSMHVGFFCPSVDHEID